MNFLENISHLNGCNTAVTIGVFDGVHKGHQRLINDLIQEKTSTVTPVVLTFSNHPSEVLRPEQSAQLITNSETKIKLIKNLGINEVIPIEFTKQLAAISANEFCNTIISALNPIGFVIGNDFSVGKGREGNVKFLKELGKKHNFWVRTIDDFTINNEPVRSRLIRSKLLEGNVKEANTLLGHPFELNGLVVHGNKRGRELGYPTANMNINSTTITPADGIYSTTTYINEELYESVTSIGIRPTFGLKQRLIETYIMNYQGDLYDSNLEIHFLDKIRPQVQFDSIEELISQIESDVEESKRIIKSSTRIQNDRQ